MSELDKLLHNANMGNKSRTKNTGPVPQEDEPIILGSTCGCGDKEKWYDYLGKFFQEISQPNMVCTPSTGEISQLNKVYTPPIEEILINEAGGKQHAVIGDFTTLDFLALQEPCEVLQQGARAYGVRNWTNIPEVDHINHAIQHLVAYSTDVASDDNHLANAFCRVMFALGVRARNNIKKD